MGHMLYTGYTCVNLFPKVQVNYNILSLKQPSFQTSSYAIKCKEIEIIAIGQTQSSNKQETLPILQGHEMISYQMKMSLEEK